MDYNTTGGVTADMLELSTDAGAVMADPSQLSQVILNLLTNAGDSLKDGRGWVVARTERIRLGGMRSNGQPTTQVLPSGDYLRFTVQDDGVGMTPETLDRIFDPYHPVTGYVDYWSAAATDARIWCYGSVLDNVTSDPTTVPPQ